MHFIFTFIPVFIYNVTVNISDDIHQDWLQWMKDVHMPEVMRTGCFVDSQMLKVLYVEDEGHTYSVQYRFLEMSDLESYQKNHASRLQAETAVRYQDKFAAFRTILQQIN